MPAILNRLPRLRAWTVCWHQETVRFPHSLYFLPAQTLKQHNYAVQTHESLNLFIYFMYHWPDWVLKTWYFPHMLRWFIYLFFFLWQAEGNEFSRRSRASREAREPERAKSAAWSPKRWWRSRGESNKICFLTSYLLLFSITHSLIHLSLFTSEGFEARLRLAVDPALSISPALLHLTPARRGARKWEEINFFPFLCRFTILTHFLRGETWTSLW